MKVLYIHGYGSSYDPMNPKVLFLSSMGYEVVGHTVDYAMGYERVVTELKNFVLVNHIDMVVGTSMGGWTAAELGHMFGIPFIAINPVIYPSVALLKYIDKPVKYGTSVASEIDRATCESYPNMVRNGDSCASPFTFGLVIVGKYDDVIHVEDTLKYCKNYHLLLAEGDHRFNVFDHEVLRGEIGRFVEMSRVMGSEDFE